MKTFFLFFALSATLLAVPEGGVPVPSRTGNSPLPIGATYVDWYRNFSDAKWTEEFNWYRRMGFTHLFLAASGRLDFTGTKIESPIFPSKYASESGARDLLGLFLQLAEERDMFIHVGSLQTYGDWTTGAEFDNLRAMNMNLYREIIQRYGLYKSFVGANWSIELWLNWALTEKLDFGRDYPGSKIASQFIQDIRSLRQETGKALVTSFSPVFKKQAQGAMRGLAPIELGNAMVEILRLAKFDLAMLQDGIGVGTQTGSAPLSELGQYMQWARAGADSSGTEFWSTVEVFTDDQNVAPGSARPRHAFRPASIDRIAQQIAAALPHTRGLIMWIAGDHMSPMATYEPIAAATLAAQYRARYDSRFTNPAQVQVFNYLYQYGIPPHPSLADPTKLKLTDGRGLGYNAFVNGNPDHTWNNFNGPDAGVGFMATTTNTNTKILFDLNDIDTKVGQIKIAYRTGLGAIAPSTPEAVEVSNNGRTWTTATVQSRVRPATDAQFGISWSVLNVNTQGRYLRITVPFAKAGWYVIGEVQFFGERDPNPPAPAIKILQDSTEQWRTNRTAKVKWTYSGPKIDGSNTWIVLQKVSQVDILRLPLPYFCGYGCGQTVITKGAVTQNGENQYEFTVPDIPGAYWVIILTDGPVYHRKESEYPVHLDYAFPQ